MLFFDCLLAVDIDAYDVGHCNCAQHGSNSISPRYDYVVRNRFGNDVLERSLAMKSPLLKGLSQRPDSGNGPILHDFDERYRGLEIRPNLARARA